VTARSRLIRLLEQEYARGREAGAPGCSAEEAHHAALEHVRRIGYQILGGLERAGVSPLDEDSLDA
jgi:hypothetical protein